MFSFLYIKYYWKPFDESLDKSRRGVWAERSDTSVSAILTFPVTFHTLPFWIDAVGAQTSVFLPFGWQGAAFHPAKASVGEPRRWYFCKCMVTACTVWKGASYYFGNKNSPADLFADLICDLDRERYLWLVDISGTTRSRICMLGWINTRVEFSLAKRIALRITLAYSPREF